jgi:hypothetical protein
VEHPAFVDTTLTDDALADILDDGGNTLTLGNMAIIYYSVIGG